MFEELREIIERNDSIVIFGHTYPDGDCYGSQIGLREILRLNYPNKKVYAVGTGIRRFFDFIAPMDVVDDETIKNSLAIIVDGNDFSRMEDQRVETAKEHIKIDHHIENYRFTQGKFIIDTSANSTCEIVLRFAIESGWAINPTIANALFLGILTDTGRFQFVIDFSSCFEEVAFLCKNGANPKAINDVLNVTNEQALKFKGYVYNHYRKTKGGVIYLILTYEQLKKLRVSSSKANSMVNLLNNVVGYPIWAFFCEYEDGSCHAEFRSNGPGVQPIASKYGGGGHFMAAGVTIPDIKEETIKPILKDLDKAIAKYKKEKH